MQPDYSSLSRELNSLLESENDYVANAANVSAFVMDQIPDLNWVGFYFLRPNGLDSAELVLGPFQGKLACTRIALDRGVCGQAFRTKQIMNVPDVHAFPGHIACDLASASECVVPLVYESIGLGVFDVDSPSRNRFDDNLQSFLTKCAQIYLEKSQFTELVQQLTRQF